MLKISWKSDKEWLQENVLKICGFIWNIQGNVLVWKYSWMYISVEVSVKFYQEVDLKKMQVSIKKKPKKTWIICNRILFKYFCNN